MIVLSAIRGLTNPILSHVAITKGHMISTKNELENTSKINLTNLSLSSSVVQTKNEERGLKSAQLLKSLKTQTIY